MGGYFTDREEIFPSIYIQQTFDKTQAPPEREGGQVCGMGWVDVGNPLLPISMNFLDKHRKSTNAKHYPLALQPIAFKNMSTYTIQEFFQYSNSRTLHLSRIMGIDSKVSILKVKQDLTLDDTEKIDIFKNGTMDSWEETDSTNSIEMLIKFCPISKVTVRLRNEDDYLTVEIIDDRERVLYSVLGHCDPLHTDDGGTSDYIGNRANCNYLSIRADVNHDDYNSNFSIVQTFDNLATDSGDYEVETFHRKNLRKVMQKCSYFLGLGVDSQILLQNARTIAHEFTTRMIIDLVTDDLATAIQKKRALGFADEDTDWYWSRTKYRFNEGVQNIPLSGIYGGMRVSVNINGKKGRAENRMIGVAGVDYPINRNLICGLEDLTREEKIALTNERINTIELKTVGSRDVLVFTDVLSGMGKNTQQKSSPIADSIAYLKKEAGYIMETALFKSNSNAEEIFRYEFNLFVQDCKSQNFFDKDVAEPVGYTLHDEDGDKSILEIWAYMDGVLRRGHVKFNLLRKES